MGDAEETLVPSKPSVTITAEKDMNARAVAHGNWCSNDNDMDFMPFKTQVTG